MDTNISGYVSTGLKVTTVFLLDFKKQFLSVYSSQKCEPQGQIKGYVAPKKQTTTTTTTTKKRHSGMAALVVTLEGQAPNAILLHLI